MPIKHRLMKADRREKMIFARVTEEEYRAVKADAGRIPLSDYLRSKVLIVNGINKLQK